MSAKPDENIEWTDEGPIPALLDRLRDAESRLAALNRDVEHLQRLAMVGTLAAGVVHEINNILTPALAHAQLGIRRPDEPEALVRALDQCVLGITQAGRVAQTLVAFSSNGDSLTDSTTDSVPAANIAQAVKSTLACLANTPKRQGIHIEAAVPPDAWVAIDPLPLQQVFLNLLLNAIKALSGVSEPTIRISTRLVPKDEIEIRVEDNGPGIPKSIAHNPFAPFATAAVSPHKSKGTGLGLAITRRIVEMAGGIIEAGQKKPTGAVFTIRLPSIRSERRAKSA